MKKNLLISILLLAVFTAFAQKLPFQGKLIENGVAVDSTLSFEFSIPSLEWSETHGDVVITDGLYFVVLGSINPLPDSLFYGTDEQSLDISVDGTALSPVVLFKPLATPYEGSELNVRNSEGTVVGSMKARTDSVKHGELKIMGENTGIFEAGFYKANDDLETDIPFISLEKDSTTLSYMSALKWNDNLNGRIYLGSTGGDYANIYPNQFNGRHNGRSLFHIGHADWSNTGNFGLLLLDGPNSGNFELTGQHWGNPDLPFLKMKGSENQSTLTLSVENNPDESGTISLNTKRDENLIYRELNINSTGLQIREKENWNVLHEAVSINAENRDDLGWAGYLNLSGPNWGNVYMGTQGNPDLPLMTLQGTDNHEAVEIGCYDSPWQEGYIVVRANNDDYMRFDATGISGSLPIEISNGANVTNDLNVNGNIIATGTITPSSDKRFKKNIQSIGSTLQKIELMEGVSYDWRQDEFPEKNFSSDKQIGLIAQDLEAQFPALVKTDKEGYKSVNYNGFTAVLLEAVKELNAKVEKLEAENNHLKAELSTVSTNTSELGILKEQMEVLSKLVQEQHTASEVDAENITTVPGLK